ncbi:hypothetical protein ACOI1H_19780 [Loktanella sp. DJP18]|uniref:hypothetical protein n=1 Tax=Loktanella sp. DJP18 TaxID=3409788 RepID=UPI003BB781F2
MLTKPVTAEHLRTACIYVGSGEGIHREAVADEICAIISRDVFHHGMMESVLYTRRIDLIRFVEKVHGAQSWGALAQLQRSTLERVRKAKLSAGALTHVYRSIIEHAPMRVADTISPVMRHVSLAEDHVFFRLLLERCKPTTYDITRLLLDVRVTEGDIFRRETDLVVGLLGDMKISIKAAAALSAETIKQTAGPDASKLGTQATIDSVSKRLPRSFAILAKLGLAQQVDLAASGGGHATMIHNINQSLGSYHGRMYLMASLPPIELLVKAPDKIVRRDVTNALGPMHHDL